MNQQIDPAVRSRAVAAARGLVPFDILITGCSVVDVAMGTLRQADIGLVGPLIASVHKPGRFVNATRRVDATGRYVAPGFMDLHVHFESSMLTPERYAEAVVPRGTTTVFGDPHELANVTGLDGVHYAIEASRAVPLRYVFQAPSCVPPAPGLELSGADFLGPEIGAMLGWPDVAGVAEVMDMRGVLERHPRMVDVVAAGLESGKLVSGHAWSLQGIDLQAYLAAGITSDHEIGSAADAIEKLESGMTVELRGAIEGVIEPLAELLADMPAVPPHLVTCTDDIFAHVLMEEGGIDDLLRRLIGAGVEPIQAIRAATLNGAYRLGRSDLGLVAAGRLADLVILSDLPGVVVDDVFFEGEWVASNGMMLAPVLVSDVRQPLDTVKVPRLPADAFQIRVPGTISGRATLRVVAGVREGRHWEEVTVDVVDGKVVVPPGYLVMASVHRHGRAAPVPACALVSEWGDWVGALATTVSHDTHNLVVFGRDHHDMAAAANALIDCGGGLAAAAGGKVLATLELPVAGLLSDKPLDELAADQKRLQGVAVEVATFSQRYRRPIFQILAASLACNPGPCVTDIGLVDGTKGERVDLVVSAN
jgi:adenine deaminase